MKQLTWILMFMVASAITSPLLANGQDAAADHEENELIAAAYDQALASESRDRQWADATERQAREALILQVDEGVSMVDVVCATSFCRASLRLERANDNVVETLATTEPFNTAGWIRFHKDSEELSLYFVRPGYSLPGTDPNGF